MFNFSPPAVDSTAIYGPIIVTSNPFRHYVTPTVNTHHIPGHLDHIYDGLSRHISPQDLGLDPALMRNTTEDMTIVNYITLCDPAQELTDQLSHVTLLQQCKQLLLT